MYKHYCFDISPPAGLFTDRVIRPGDDDYDPKGRFSHDSEGNKYPDGKVCYTSDCLDNQVDFSTYAPFPEMLNETYQYSLYLCIRLLLKESCPFDFCAGLASRLP